MFPYSLLLPIYILFINSEHILIIAATSILRSSNAFTDTSIWMDDHLPCANELIHFPSNYAGLLMLPAKVNVAGFVLPSIGAILLPLNGEITFHNKKDEDDKNCQGNNGAILRSPLVYKWFDPVTWLKTSDTIPPINKATPSIDQLPCNNEAVIIPPHGSIAFDMQKVHSIGLGHLNFAESSISRDYLQNLLSSNDLGNTIFRNLADGMTVEYYRRDACGCLKNFNEYLEPVCRELMAECPSTACEMPIQPLGDCCPICGASLRFKVNTCNATLQRILENHIRKHLGKGSKDNNIDFYVNYYQSEELGVFLQAVIVDRNGYNEESVRFLKSLNESTNWEQLLSMKAAANRMFLEFHVSGGSYGPFTGVHIFLFILCLLIGAGIVVIVYHNSSGVVYDHRHVMEQWWRSLRHGFSHYSRQILVPANYTFARFDNGRESIQTRFGEAQATDPVSPDLPSMQETTEQRAFNNPMFTLTATTTTDNNSRDQVESSPPEKEKEAEKIVPSDSTAALEERQEMVEISLEETAIHEENLPSTEETKLN